MLCILNRLKIILVISFLFLTGCSVKYDITINDDKDLIESLDIIENDKTKFDLKNEDLFNATLKEYLETDLKWPTPVFLNTLENPIEPIRINNIDYYNKRNSSTDNTLDINYNYSYKQSKYGQSNIVNNCYEYKFSSSNNIINFETISSFKCFEKYKLLDEVEFNLNTYCKVVQANYDTNNNNKYIWKINKDNINKKIIFKLDCSTKKNNDFNLSIIIIVCSYVFIILFLILMLRIIFAVKNKL
jgi:hypothetical protein